MENNTETLQYPVGRYTQPKTFDKQQLKEWTDILKALPLWMDACIENLDEPQLHIPYREGGWTIQQVVHHVADSHMNAYIRLKSALTTINPSVAPYEEKAWALTEDVNKVPVNISVTLLHALHLRLVALIDGLSPADLERTYYHPGYDKTFSVWEVISLYAWHSRHHTAHIMELRKRMNIK